MLNSKTTTTTTTSLLPFFFLHLLLPPRFTSATTLPLYPLGYYPTKSGYLPITTSSTTNSSLFFTFYESQQQRQPTSSLLQTPILIWLQGGPGCSSMIGNFFELGPYLLFPNDNFTNLQHNPNSWNRIFGLLFIDNPIGTGFSIAASSSDIPTDQTTVAKHLWFGIQSFLDSNPRFRSRPVWLTGESYAGKYVPATASYISRKNEVGVKRRRIDLRGVAIGNGLTHPVVQVTSLADTAYYGGLINGRQRSRMKELQKEAVELTVKERWPEATDARNRVLNYLKNATGLASLYDLRRKIPYETAKVGEFLQSEDVRAALGVNMEIAWEECSSLVGSKLHSDVMKSVKTVVEELLEKNIRVLLYQGEFDLRDGVTSTVEWIEELKWSDLDGFLAAERKVWKVDGEVAGYVQRWNSLTHVVVRGAGHLVPADQGRSSQAMIEGWVLQYGFFSDGKNRNIV